MEFWIWIAVISCVLDFLLQSLSKTHSNEVHILNLHLEYPQGIPNLSLHLIPHETECVEHRIYVSGFSYLIRGWLLYHIFDCLHWPSTFFTSIRRRLLLPLESRRPSTSRLRYYILYNSWFWPDHVLFSYTRVNISTIRNTVLLGQYPLHVHSLDSMNWCRKRWNSWLRLEGQKIW